MDVILLGFIGGFIVGGYRTGFVRRVAGLGFLALSFVLGAYLRAPVGGLISATFGNVGQTYGEMVAYILLFPALLVIAHILAGPLLARVAVDGVSRQMNLVLGAIFGFVEAILILSVVIVILDTYVGAVSTLPTGAGLGFLTSWRDALDASTTAHLLRDSTVPAVLTVLGPLLPGDLTSVIGGVPGLPRGLPGIPAPKPTPGRT